MNILLTSHRFWPAVGGTEQVVERLAQAYARRGHQVTVATSAEPGAPAEEARDGYSIRRFDVRHRGRFRFPPRAYREFVLARPWDVVHLHGQRVWSTDYLYRHLARAASPVVFTAHGFYQHHMAPFAVHNLVYYRGVLPRALRHCAAVTALTSAERTELLEWGVDEERIHVIPDGLDASEFDALPGGFRERHGIAEGERLVLYAGGFYPNKRVDRLVRAAADARATLVALGREAHRRHGRQQCADIARRLGVRFVAPGLVPRDEVLAAYAAADVFALGSEFEGFGLVLLEAMASGLPFVSTPAGAAPDLAAHGAGVVAPPDALGRELSRLLADDARRRQMGARGRDAVAAYGWGRIAERYLALYEEVGR